MIRINWRKIDIITFTGEYMSAVCKSEVCKAFDLLRFYEHTGEKGKAAYIRHRIRQKMDYTIH